MYIKKREQPVAAYHLRFDLINPFKLDALNVYLGDLDVGQNTFYFC